MIFPDLLFAIVIAGLFTALFAMVFDRKGPWGSIPVFFIIVFLAAWAGGVWATPVGPPIWGGYWLPFMFMGLLFALLLAAATPPPSTVEIEEKYPERRQAETSPAVLTFEIFFWVLFITFLVVILTRYIWL